LEFRKLIESRHSVREFKPEQVDETKLKRILEAANSAPSAGNLQAYEILVVKDEGKRKALSEACMGQEFIAQAPLALLFFANPERSARKYGERGKTLYCILDAAIAASYAQLAIADEGLSTVWVGALNDEEIKKITNAPAHLVPVGLLPVGKADEKPESHARRELFDLVKHEQF